MRSAWMQTTREIEICGPAGDVTMPAESPVLLVNQYGPSAELRRIIEFPGGRTCHVEHDAVKPWPRT